MSSKYRVGIATYDEIIDALKDVERLLIDVRDPSEITESGQIPTSLNIPCKLIFSVDILNHQNSHRISNQSLILIFYRFTRLNFFKWKKFIQN